MLRILAALGVFGLMPPAPSAAPAASEPKAARPSHSQGQRRAPKGSSRGGRRSSSRETKARIAERRKGRMASLQQKAVDKEAEADRLARRAESEGLNPERAKNLKRRAAALRAQADKARRTITRMQEGPLSPEQRRAAIKASGQRLQKSNRTRLKQQWGKTLQYPRVRQEIRTNAERTAKLMRIRRLARSAGDVSAEARCSALLSKENKRFRQIMSALDQLAKREAAKPRETPQAAGDPGGGSLPTKTANGVEPQ